MKKLRKMLGKYNDDYIIELMKLIEIQSKETIAKWCMDYAEDVILLIYVKYYLNDNRPKMALNASRDWFKGLKKLPEVKDIILNSCHQAAHEAEENSVLKLRKNSWTSSSLLSYSNTFVKFSILWWGSNSVR